MQQRAIRILFLLLLSLQSNPLSALGSPERPPSQSTVLEQFQKRIRAAAAKGIPSVVQIEVTEIIPLYPDEEYRKTGLGSGILLQRDGDSVFLLTNNHVLGEAAEITVRLSDGESYPARIHGTDERRDLAVVRFEAAGPLQFALLGDSDRLQVGDWVLAVGSPLGLESSATLGVVSALGRRGGPGGNIGDFIQTDAVINPGSSGGALLDLDGEVIGINTWIASESGRYEGYGFALPVNMIKRTLQHLLSQAAAVYGWLGLGGIDPPEYLKEELSLFGAKGALVVNLYRGSPAQRYGLQLGDYILQIDDQEVHDIAGLIQVVADKEPGTVSRVHLLRAGQLLQTDVAIGRRPPEGELPAYSQRFWPGMIAVAASGTGVELAHVFSGTPADQAGFRTGDRIEMVNDAQIHTVADFFAALNQNADLYRISILRGSSVSVLDLCPQL